MIPTPPAPTSPMVDVEVTLRLPANTTMAALRDLLVRISQSENMRLKIGTDWPFHAELIASQKEAA